MLAAANRMSQHQQLISKSKMETNGGFIMWSSLLLGSRMWIAKNGSSLWFGAKEACTEFVNTVGSAYNMPKESTNLYINHSSLLPTFPISTVKTSRPNSSMETSTQGSSYLLHIGVLPCNPPTLYGFYFLSAINPPFLNFLYIIKLLKITLCYPWNSFSNFMRQRAKNYWFSRDIGHCELPLIYPWN